MLESIEKKCGKTKNANRLDEII